jgi:hypothetical protein
MMAEHPRGQFGKKMGSGPIRATHAAAIRGNSNPVAVPSGVLASMNTPDLVIAHAILLPVE